MHKTEAKFWKNDASTIELTVCVEGVVGSTQKGAKRMHRYKRTPSCTTNTDPVMLFTMTGLASDDALCGKCYCSYSVIPTTA